MGEKTTHIDKVQIQKNTARQLLIRLSEYILSALFSMVSLQLFCYNIVKTKFNLKWWSNEKYNIDYVGGCNDCRFR